MIERIMNRQHHELAVRQGLGRRIYRDTARWPLYLERKRTSLPVSSRRARLKPINNGWIWVGSCMKLPHLGELERVVPVYRFE